MCRILIHLLLVCWCRFDLCEQCLLITDPAFNVPCQDCAGTPNGGLVFDACGICGGDNSTCSDICGVVAGDGTSCLDCAGVVDGIGAVDACGVCVLGGEDSDLFNRSCSDCNGVVEGPSRIDVCGVCLEPSDPNFDRTCEDCSGDANGGRVEDACGLCLLENDNLFNQTCADCLGVPNGPARLDVCGVCNGDNSTCIDCAGVGGGSARFDNCTGVCCGGTTGLVCDEDQDACFVCFGDNSTCLDCNGVPAGDATEDACGVCDGPDRCPHCDPRPDFPRNGFCFHLEPIIVYDTETQEFEAPEPLIGNRRYFFSLKLDIPPSESSNFALIIERFSGCTGDGVPPYTSADPNNTGCFSVEVFDNVLLFISPPGVSSTAIVRADVDVNPNPDAFEALSLAQLSAVVFPLSGNLSLPQNITYQVVYSVVAVDAPDSPNPLESGNARTVRKAVTCAGDVGFDPERFTCGSGIRGAINQVALIVPLLIGSCVCCICLCVMFYILDRKRKREDAPLAFTTLGVGKKFSDDGGVEPESVPRAGDSIGRSVASSYHGENVRQRRYGREAAKLEAAREADLERALHGQGGVG